MTAQLRAKGWIYHAPFQSTLTRLKQLWLEPYPYNATPIIPPLLGLTPPSLIFSKVSNDKIYILRLWENPGTQKLLIGTLSYDFSPKHVWSIQNLVCDNTRYDVENMPIDLKYQRIIRTNTSASETQWQPYCWNGSTLIFDEDL